jgi:hypothetical protein
MMSWTRPAIYASLIAFILSVLSACESVALMPRPDMDQRDTVRGQTSREPLSGRLEREPDRSKREVVGTVQRVDEARREIHLRTGDRNLMVLRYDPRTVVYDRDRTLAVADLRQGDEIAAQPFRNSGYDSYVDVIRMVDRRSQLEY